MSVRETKVAMQSSVSADCAGCPRYAAASRVSCTNTLRTQIRKECDAICSRDMYDNGGYTDPPLA